MRQNMWFLADDGSPSGRCQRTPLEPGEPQLPAGTRKIRPVTVEARRRWRQRTITTARGLCREQRQSRNQESREQKTEISMKNKLILLAFAVAAMNAHATLYTTNWNSGFLNSGQIPDNNPSGWSNTRTVAASGAIQSIAVTLRLSSAWNGDLYACLLHDSGFTVLLNHF